MKTGSIHQTIDFNSSPAYVYKMIMDQDIHSQFTGGPVEMSKEIKGTFRVFDGYCSGYNEELAEGEKIVQAWHFQEDGWPDDHYSMCTFVFNKTPDGCQLDFTQTGIPEHKVEALTEGWETYYWQPMKNYLDEI